MVLLTSLALAAASAARMLGDVAPDAPDAFLGYLPWALPPLGIALLLYLRARQRAKPPQRSTPP